MPQHYIELEAPGSPLVQPQWRQRMKKKLRAGAWLWCACRTSWSRSSSSRTRRTTRLGTTFTRWGSRFHTARACVNLCRLIKRTGLRSGECKCKIVSKQALIKRTIWARIGAMCLAVRSRRSWWARTWWTTARAATYTCWRAKMVRARRTAATICHCHTGCVCD